MSVFRKLAFLAIGVGVLIFVGYLTSDRTDYPGRAQFEEADSLLTSNSRGLVHGDSEETKAAASAFASTIKGMQAAFFSGGSGRSLATGGDFLTYVKRTPTAVVILCHVPELRNYKDPKTREALARVAWVSAQTGMEKLSGLRGSETLIVGLRGFASYGPIWEGTVSGEATKKTDDMDEKKRLYPFFAEAAPAPAPGTEAK